jgi:hypothetical protein
MENSVTVHIRAFDAHSPHMRTDVAIKTVGPNGWTKLIGVET